MFSHLEVSDDAFIYVHDTEFCELTAYFGAGAIMKVYRRRGLNVLNALKLYYRNSIHHTIRSVILESDNISYPQSLKEYYPCLKNYITQLEWIGK